MAKRRRRIKIKNTSLLAALTTLLSLLLFATSAANSHQHHHNHNNYHHPTSQQDYKLLASQAAQQQQQQTILGNNSPTSAGASTLHLCAQLPLHTARQLKLCKLVGHSASVDEALAAGASKGLAECRSQFKNERWNCTHSLAGGGDHNLLTSELAQSVGNRESGFLNAITAAGIVHAIATACSVGSLRDCACDKTRVGLIRRHEDSRIGWGGCSNNIRHGMVYAKHLVELLDAYHQHERLQHEQPDEQATTTHRGKRALSRADTEPMQIRGRHHHHQRPHLHHPHHHSHQSRQALVHDPPQAASGTSQVEQQQQLAFCQRNHNISQAAHFKLIKSLLSKNSLERHQEFRLAMNMHNNKIGRMAVAKNMELRCRCHGLSGSCSLKTCWQTLPDFQLIGAYLRKKYDASVHLPTAIDVNKLIPMMDRAEISAILNGGAAADQSPAPTRLLTGSLAPTSDSYTTVSETVSSGGHLLASSSSASGKPDEPAPEFAPLVAAGPPAGRIQLSGHFIMTPTTSTTPSPAAKQQQLVDLSAYSPLNAPANPLYASYFESIRRQQQTSTTATTPQQVTASVPEATLATTVATTTTTTTSAMSDLSLQEIPATNIAPMTQQQYQALIRDMKLCNNSSTLLAREIQPEQQQHQGGGSKRIGGGTSKKTQTAFSAYQYQQQQQATTSGQQMKNANQQLSHLLHSNKDELIHLHKSPDYCEADVRHGFAGIQSRQCSENPLAPDNCDKLCCGRGYTKHTYQQEYQCDCKFQYCCEILCSICKREIKVVLCK